MDAAARAASDAPRSVDEALDEVDRLRAEGRVAEAADLLEDALARDPDATAAGLAAFTLGRIALDQLGQHDRAARAFAKVIAAGSPSSLLEDAHARRVDALIRAGRRADAEAALAEYERSFPEARRIARLRERLAAP
jgi:tetratricopeptide (TPR) repeat protein